MGEAENEYRRLLYVAMTSAADRLIVPVQAGSGADAILRIVANKMAENLKQQIVLDNQPGAAGLIARCTSTPEAASTSNSRTE